ncbi:MAG TPA: sulfite exporter TauE/SafE family protein [Dehalococcoidales bacterium]|nr:sulfite exporter TauE/SafE family protein [Dehalococcoidales bacterium]
MLEDLFSTLGALFVAGLTLGVSQCLLTCAPMLVLYVAGTAEVWQAGFKAALVFSLSRLLAYTLLGALAGGIGMWFLAELQEEAYVHWIQLGAAVFIILLGILVIIGRNTRLHLCQFLSRYTLKNSILSMALLGFLSGIAPYCTPFLGILTYIAFDLRDLPLGALCGFTFGLGATLITPLLIVGPLAGALPRLFKSPLLLGIFRRVSGVLLLILGISLALTTIERL